MTTPLWSPSQKAVIESALTRLSKKASKLSGNDLSSYSDLHNWSITEVDAFWNLVWEDTGVIGDKGDLAFSPGK